MKNVVFRTLKPYCFVLLSSSFYNTFDTVQKRRFEISAVTEYIVFLFIFDVTITIDLWFEIKTLTPDCICLDKKMFTTFQIITYGCKKSNIVLFIRRRIRIKIIHKIITILSSPRCIRSRKRGHEDRVVSQQLQAAFVITECLVPIKHMIVSTMGKMLLSIFRQNSGFYIDLEEYFC